MSKKTWLSQADAMRKLLHGELLISNTGIVARLVEDEIKFDSKCSFTDLKWRIYTETMKIPSIDIEIPMPFTPANPPIIRQYVYLVNIQAKSEYAIPQQIYLEEDVRLNNLLSLGYLHKTQEAAYLHSKALQLLSKSLIEINPTTGEYQ